MICVTRYPYEPGFATRKAGLYYFVNHHYDTDG